MTNMETCLELTKDELNEILLGDNGTNIPLLQQRYLCLQQSAYVLLKKYKGNKLHIEKISKHFT